MYNSAENAGLQIEFQTTEILISQTFLYHVTGNYTKTPFTKPYRQQSVTTHSI